MRIHKHIDSLSHTHTCTHSHIYAHTQTHRFFLSHSIFIRLFVGARAAYTFHSWAAVHSWTRALSNSEEAAAVTWTWRYPHVLCHVSRGDGERQCHDPGMIKCVYFFL